MIQIKTFDDITSNLQDEVNKFLLEKKDAIISVTPLYNTINGGIQYVVVYNKETKARKHTSPLLQEFDAEIHSEVMKENAIGFVEWAFSNGFYRNAAKTNLLWVTEDNDYYSGCAYTGDELLNEYITNKEK